MNALIYGGEWWISWRDQPWALRESGGYQPLSDFANGKLANDDPAAVAVGLMCIAMALQHIRPGTDDLGLDLASSPKELDDRVCAAVDQVILSKDQYLTTQYGILVLMMRAKHHVEGNQLRKAWLRIRQAILALQAMDFAAGSSHGPQNDEVVARQRWVGGIFELDRFMSMMLGLPYATDPNFTDKLASTMLWHSSDIGVKMRALRRIVAVAAGQINDRDSRHQQDDIALTNGIQATLDNTAAAMPVTWWDIAAHVDCEDGPTAHENLMAQLWFWNVQCFLHLPFMLQAVTNSEYEHNRQLCLQGARNTLRVFNMLRIKPTLSVFTCNCEDFQGLLAACTLLVGLLQYASEGIEPPDGFDTSLTLVDQTRDVFAYRAQQQGGSISKQGLKVLEHLSDFLDDEEGITGKKSIILPYFGTIVVESNAGFRRPLMAGCSNPTTVSLSADSGAYNFTPDAESLEDGTDLAAMDPHSLPDLVNTDAGSEYLIEMQMFDQDIVFDWEQFDRTMGESTTEMDDAWNLGIYKSSGGAQLDPVISTQPML